MTVHSVFIVFISWLSVNAVSAQPFEGEASYYADKFEGKPTANGEKYRKAEFTAAHRSLPFGTVLRVTNLDNGREVVVRINDRGPFVKGRIIDLSRAAAEALDFIPAGIARVRIELISGGKAELYFSEEGKPFSPEGYSLQLASFTQHANAMNFMKSMRSELKESVFMEVREKENIPYYRILIGPYPNKNMALVKKETLSRSFPSLLVREHPQID